MIRTTFFVFLLTLLLVAFGASTPTPDTVFIVDGKKMDVTYPPKFTPDDVLVWVGDLVRFGWVSIESQGKGELVIKRESVTLGFQSGKTEVSINSLTIESNTAPKIISGRFFIPLAFTCRALGFKYGVRSALVIESETNPSHSSAATAIGKNSIIGKVLYNGRPVAGIKVRAVTEKNVFVEGAIATTNNFGEYVLRDLPDGIFRPYVYVGDNTDYFNRIGELVLLADEASVDVRPINLGRILNPQFPMPQDEVTCSGSKLKLSWSECPEAVKYRVTVEDVASSKTVFDVTVTEASAKVPVKLLATGRVYHWYVTVKGTNGAFIGGSPAGGKTLWTFKLKK
jgi:hypothetical protein